MFGDRFADILLNKLIRAPSILTEAGPAWKPHRQVMKLH